MRRIAFVLALVGWAAVGQAQGPVPGTPNQSPTQQPNGGGIGGLGIRLSFGKKQPKVPELPPLEMRDAAISDHVEGRVLFVLALPGSTAAKEIGRAHV